MGFLHRTCVYWSFIFNVVVKSMVPLPRGPIPNDQLLLLWTGVHRITALPRVMWGLDAQIHLRCLDWCCDHTKLCCYDDVWIHFECGLGFHWLIECWNPTAKNLENFIEIKVVLRAKDEPCYGNVVMLFGTHWNITCGCWLLECGCWKRPWKAWGLLPRLVTGDIGAQRDVTWPKWQSWFVAKPAIFPFFQDIYCSRNLVCWVLNIQFFHTI